MAFFKRGKKKKKAKGILLGMLLMALISVGVIGLLYMQHKRIVDDYKAKLEELQRVFEEETQQVIRVVEPIKAGEKFKTGKVEAAYAPNAITPDNAVLNATDLEGKIAKLDIHPNTTILKSMLVEESIPDNARELELNMLLLPSNLTTDHYLDIRINFPTGEDYVVVSKKKVRDLFLKENTVWLWLSEREILELSSAIIDAYLREGAKLYCVTYIDPMFQDDAIPNYPENLYVLDLIQKDPNIIDRAIETMASEIRMQLEDKLNNLAKEDSERIKGNIINEKSKRGLQVQELINSEVQMKDSTETITTNDTSGMFDN